MQRIQVLVILVLFLLIILIPALLLSFFSINAIQNQETLYQRRLEDRYKNIIQRIREQSQKYILEEERKYYRSLLSPLEKGDLDLLRKAVQERVDRTSLFRYPFVLSGGKRLLPIRNNLIVSDPARSLIIEDILRPATSLELGENKLEQALNEYRRILVDYRNQADVHIQAMYSMSRCYMAQKNYGEALTVLQELERIYPLKQGNSINYVTFHAKLELAPIYAIRGDFFLYGKTILEMWTFLIEHQEAFGNRFHRWKKILEDRIQPYLEPAAPVPDFWSKKPSPRAYSWVRQEWKKLQSWKSEWNEKHEFFELFDQGILSYLSKRLNKNYLSSTKRTEERLTYITSLEGYIYQGHLAESPGLKSPIFYFILPWKKTYILIGASMEQKYFADQVVRPRIWEVGEDQEVEIVLLTKGDDGLNHLAEMDLLHPFDNFRLVARLRDSRLFYQLSNVRMNTYVYGITLAVIAIVLGALGSIAYVLRQLKIAQLKSDFVSNVTHELKTPLTSIRMFVETLIMGRVNSKEEEQECLKIISDESERLARLIDKVLDFSALENRIKSFKFVNVNLEELVENTIEVFKQQIDTKKCNISFHAVQKLRPVRVDKDAIHEVLINLLTNAYKYTDDEEVSEITIKIKESKGYVVVEVIDNGIGIPKKHLYRVFQKFFRVQNLLTSSKEGTGLGLAICKSIIKAHRGKITVESELGKGSKFTVFIPRRK